MAKPPGYDAAIAAIVAARALGVGFSRATAAADCGLSLGRTTRILRYATMTADQGITRSMRPGGWVRGAGRTGTQGAAITLANITLAATGTIA